MSVKRLDQQTIRKIRSEQVIVDVISAVKELIENSLDAKARHIWIKLWGKGLTKIVVRDDGIGIHPSDLVLCGQRHCTSKLGRVTPGDGTIDLATAMASTYGFRGEALAALVELSKSVEITSRTQDEETGWSIKYQLADPCQSLTLPQTTPSLQVAAREIGTTIVVEGLFSNQPVRLNILKKESGQFHRRMRHLLDTYALARPEVRLQCEYVSKQLTPPSPSKSPFTKPPITHLSQPLTTLSFSVDQRQHLLHSNLTLVLGPLSTELEWFHLSDKIDGGEWCIEGFVPKKDATIERIKEGRMFCFVNSRPVEGGAFIHRLEQTWRAYVNQRRISPTCVLYIWLPPGEFDVTLNPDKRVVMFVHEDILLTQFVTFLESQYPRLDHYHQALSPTGLQAATTHESMCNDNMKNNNTNNRMIIIDSEESGECLIERQQERLKNDHRPLPSSGLHVQNQLIDETNHQHDGKDDNQFSRPYSPILDSGRFQSGENDKCEVTRDEWLHLRVVGTLQAEDTQIFILAFSSRILVLLNPLRLQEALKFRSLNSSSLVHSSTHTYTTELIRQDVCNFLEAQCCEDSAVDLHSLFCPHQKPIFVKFYSQQDRTFFRDNIDINKQHTRTQSSNQ